jgi:MFS family permease
MTRTSTSTIYTTLALMLALSGLDQTVLSTALPTIVQSLHGQSLAAWVFSTYLMASTAVIPLYGKLADRAGVRPMLLLSTGCSRSARWPVRWRRACRCWWRHARSRGWVAEG